MKIFVLSLWLVLILVLPAQAKQPLPPLHHPVGIKFPADMQAPAGFPLGKQKQLVCDTCHGIKNLDQIPLQKVNQQAKNFLRNGSYPNLLDFCQNCHQSRLKQKNMQRFNVHQMLDKQGRLIKSNCTYCHASLPDPKKDKDWHKMRFQIPPEKLCYGCHLKTTHLNAVQHQVKPSHKVLKQIRQTEKQRHLHLPLDKQGKMMCITCHTAHQHNVLTMAKQATPLGKIEYGKPNFWSRVYAEDKKARLKQGTYKGLTAPVYQPIKHEILLRLPAKNGELCRACHVFQD